MTSPKSPPKERAFMFLRVSYIVNIIAFYLSHFGGVGGG